MLYALENYLRSAVNMGNWAGAIPVVAGPYRPSGEGAVDIYVQSLELAASRSEGDPEDGAYEVAFQSWTGDGRQLDFSLPTSEMGEVLEVESPPTRPLQAGTDYYVQDRVLRFYTAPPASTGVRARLRRGERSGFRLRRQGTVRLAVACSATTITLADQRLEQALHRVLAALVQAPNFDASLLAGVEVDMRLVKTRLRNLGLQRRLDPNSSLYEAVASLELDAELDLNVARGAPAQMGRILEISGLVRATSLPSQVVSVNAQNSTPTPAPGARFVMAGTLSSATTAHTATVLGDGSVLLAGGVSPAFTNAAAPAQGFLYLYDFRTGVFMNRGSLLQRRALHTATQLRSGEVLIVGGETSGSDSLASAELYDPATSLKQVAGTLGMARQSHTATLLNDGRVLIVGGYSGPLGRLLETAELYLPDAPLAARFVLTGSTAVRRQLHSATLLRNGRVLIVGGYGDRPLGNVELYDPTTGTFSTVGTLRTPRFSHTATRLDDGRVLIAGGGNTSAVRSCEMYDPIRNTLSVVGDLATARQSHTATLLPGGEVLVTGGASALQGGQTYGSAELFDPASLSWRSAGTMQARRYHTASLLTDGRVLLVGGQASTIVQVIEMYIPEEGGTVE